MNQRKTLMLLGLFIVVLGIFGFYNSKPVPLEDLKPICFSEIQIPLTIPPMELEKTDDKQELKELMQECIDYKELILTLIPDKSSVNYYNHRNAVKQEIKNIDKIYNIYYKRYKKIITKENEEKYIKQCEKDTPVATTVWKYLKSLGYNDYVAAGIMGNLMAEVGGHTLNLRPYLYGENHNYYGICQWSIKYYPSVNGKNLNQQLDFLAKTIKYEFNTYGHLYNSKFNYSAFLNLNDASAAAKAFAKVYERCGTSTISKRQRNALVAYDYFVKK